MDIRITTTKTYGVSAWRFPQISMSQALAKVRAELEDPTVVEIRLEIER